MLWLGGAGGKSGPAILSVFGSKETPIPTPFRALPALIAAALLAVPAAGWAADCALTPSAFKLVLVADGVRSDKGLMTATVYDQKSRYLKKGGSLKVWRVPAEAPSTTLCIWLPRAGTYSAVIYHDENSNQKWDHAFPYRPLEGGGFANNPPVSTLPPSWDKTAFQVGEGETTVHITLRYPKS